MGHTFLDNRGFRLASLTPILLVLFIYFQGYIIPAKKYFPILTPKNNFSSKFATIFDAVFHLFWFLFLYLCILRISGFDTKEFVIVFGNRWMENKGGFKPKAVFFHSGASYQHYQINRWFLLQIMISTSVETVFLLFRRFGGRIQNFQSVNRLRCFGGVR